MIESIIEWSIRNRYLVILAALVLGVLSGRAMMTMPVDAIPDLSENQVIVFTDWMGRSPQEIEDQVTYPLSVNLQGLAGVKVVRSSSEFNFSMITIIFDEATDYYFAVARSNSSVGGRVIHQGNAEYLIRSVGWIENIDDIRDTVVARRENGTPIYVRQLGTVQVGPAFRRSALEKDGKETVGGVVL